ncbi:ribose transport system substrate-binding protein [Caloramator quimbayensis]|uniref:Ribose transport system substrate-binding protein n=1 Tax=Caloramator quimbayensis TaxID=1147123 RepID=A0A1T4XQA1_9CLOT|nr:substrate-binding domain-containing protein [Caloramator quimbayensis]SKA91265.1 ribose transport system substrate-binding protein [Caloramator quimbayensis]
MKYKISILLILFILILSESCMVNKSTSSNFINNKRKNIVFISKMSYGYHWATVKQGAIAASKEFNVDIDFAAPDLEENVEEQIKLVNNVIDNNDKTVNAIVLAASDYDELVDVIEKVYDKNIPVIVIDSEVNTSKISSNIITDNFEAGKKMGNILVDICGKKAKIAIMSFIKGSRNAKQREDGLISIIAKYPDIKLISKEYCYSDTSLACNLTKKLLLENEDIDGIVALNDISSEGVALAVDEMKLGGKVKVIAYDSTTQELHYLEKGVIQALVIENPFSIGYLGVKFAVDKLNGKKIPSKYLMETKVIDKNNMYLPENQRMLFPFVW